MEGRSIVIRVHAAKRMLERRITLADVRSVLDDGEVIERYTDDAPFASRLMLGWSGGRPLHVVAADDDGSTYVITAYEPDANEWEPDFRTRRRA